MTCLGVQLKTRDFTLSVDCDRLAEIKKACYKHGCTNV